MAVSVLIVLAGIWLARELALRRYPEGTWQLSIKPVLSSLYRFSLNRWYWDDFYNKFIAGGTWLVARLSVLFDRYVIDGLLHGVGAMARGGSGAVRSFQNGQVQVYALAILIGVNVLVWIVYFF